MDRSRIVKASMLLALAVGLLGVVVFGRKYVADNLSDNVWARAITGVRDEPADRAFDPTAGRVDILNLTLEQVGEKGIGVGIQVVGSEGITASGTAPLYWLLLTGLPGFFLLMGRDIVLLLSARSLVRRLPPLLPLAQALVAVMAQHLSYGSWMNPNYFIPAAMILVCSSAWGQRRLIEPEYVAGGP
jgi:hypothetical protein